MRLALRRVLLPLVLLSTGCASDPPPPRPGPVAAPENAGAAVLPARAEPTSGARVAIDAGADAEAPVAKDAKGARPRLGSIGYTTWIVSDKLAKNRIGQVRPGTTIPLRSEAPVELPRRSDHGRCKSGRLYEVEPRGYVCEDDTVTRDLEGPLFRALAFAAPREGARPYDYAFTTRAPMYGKLPTEKEQRRAERRMWPIEKLAKVRRSTDGHEDLDELTPPKPTGPMPDFLAQNPELPLPIGRREGLVRKEIPYGSMLSFSHSFDAGGRTFLLSPDLTLVPADRVRPFRPSSFRGVPIDEAHPLPLGWFRKKPRPRYRRDERGSFVETGEPWAPRTFVGLTGKKVEHDGDLFWETREPGPIYARARDVSIVREPEEMPDVVAPDEKWIDVSLGGGTLTLFEGKRAVYSTLMSPGAGGVTQDPKMKTEELVRAALTPLGRYRIAVKYRATQLTDEATPDPTSFWISDVPWVQYFRNPFAIHAAYWHEDFGSPKSGGCINLSPEDAMHVFGWTEPHVPEGWASVEARRDALGTWIVIRK
ncbi:L,D-transpeptidase [Polyangium aurulentum]|uniref:L,D-transpeptidase n=1 Tax=Polyangium aurulentum TaxID=2567896 RepID=UPI0010AEB96C|nr:L,D-transpeptidase [Polyangium aurulentum]UQA54624.1 L,D-transpeptidase [Polyangium aurulentum]